MKILEKRNSLEQFIIEQTTGPGINGYRFADLEDEHLLKSNLLNCLPIEYSNEIIDIVPAAVYSTGILFPEDASETSSSGIALDNNETIKEDEKDEEDSQNNSGDDVESTDVIELNQMFPRLMGFTCCLDEKILNEKYIDIKLQARYYKKLKRDNDGKFNSKYGLLCETNPEVTQSFLSQHQFSSFNLRVVGDNSFLTLNRLNAEEIIVLNTQIRGIQKRIAENLYDKTVNIIDLSKLKKSSCYLSNLKSTIFFDLKTRIIDEQLRKKLYDITQEIEIIEAITDQLRNLLDVNSGGYGLWQSNIIERKIRIENLSFPEPLKKKSYLFNKSDYTEKIKILLSDGTQISEGLKDIFKHKIDEEKNDYASLALNIQLSRDSRKKDKNIFLKVQLANNSTPFKKKSDDSRYYSTFNELVNQKTFFGVKLIFTNDHLIPYNELLLKQDENGIFNEDTTTKFIYKQFKDYGIGHGCSVKWDEVAKSIETEYLPTCETPDVDPIPRNKIGTCVYENNEHKDPLFLENTMAQEFKWLSIFSVASNKDIIDGLYDFVDSYGKWISIKQNNYKDGEFKEIAKQELDKCYTDFLRMKNNIGDLLDGRKNEQNLETFRLMNATMFMQLWHSMKVKQNEASKYFTKADFSGFNYDFYKSKDSSSSWRAFQLAFILLNLDGVFRSEKDLTWERRNEWVDLVWFPTGGGKTEAYLGLIALTIINRRKLHSKEGGGTAAIMRYTLRLLTMQQFQRATLVIMALELIRRWGNYNLGNEPIYIGFWVGNNSIPNKLTHNYTDTKKDSLQFEYEKLIQGKTNKIPFTSCPWCGSKLRPQTTKVNDENDVFNFNRIHLYCDSVKCSFTEPDFFEGNDLKGPIPVNLCDESIYQHPPTLLFGTVDKFAQLAHKVNGKPDSRNNDSRRIFGSKSCNWEKNKPKDGYLPPDLIIQDELHLLLGPLGSAVALFESAITQLCTREDGTRAKIISSTATTRNTSLQIAALFDRKVDLFPKPGTECDDSFFAYYKRKYSNQNKEYTEYISKRKYIGILPTGRTQIWMQMRIAAILMTHRAVFELQQIANNTPIDFDKYGNIEKAMDYYHTIISYFTSLKEVGKTQSQVQSYILKELRRVFARVIRPKKLMHSIYTYGPIQECELTGRLSGEEVKNELKNVENRWTARDRFAHVEGNDLIRGRIPSEFVVATNMISVGIDVSRFNTIIMNSMPRNTAEYIQASSRVARETYGLVLTVHHPFRARDISHYEKFIEFHEKMYSYVEPISITPFTQKAVERYMGLYLATMLRHRTAFVERNSAASMSLISDKELESIKTNLTKYFEVRKNRLSESNQVIKNLLKDENVNQIKKWVGEALEEWKDESDKTRAEGKAFVFNRKSTRAIPPQEQLYVDIEEYEGNIHSEKWQIPMSLRVIEPAAAIKINSK
ncbi:MAG TPA: helicase-related protein [Chitinophagaceae bacterium]|nr:helicase-related protein [Chitinophagaceae bacterium]